MLKKSEIEYIENISSRKFTCAQKALQNALLLLNGEKEIYNISVQELCNKAGVARSTFYSYYDNINELCHELEDELIYQLMQANLQTGRALVNKQADFPYFQRTVNVMQEHRLAFEDFILKHPNISFIKKWQSAIKYHYYFTFLVNRDIHNKNLLLEQVSVQAISAYVYWLRYPDDVDIEELNKSIVRILKLFDIN